LNEEKEITRKAKLIELAALLHDIGKFYQRTEKRGTLTENDKSLYCPYNNKGQYYGYVHASYTAIFIKEFRDIFPDVINYEELMSVSARHHVARDSTDILENIVKNADWISAGVDRSIKEDKYSDEEILRYYEKPLTSIFSAVTLNKEYNMEKLRSYSLNEFSLEKDKIFPTINPVISREVYKKLWKDFIGDFSKLKGFPYNNFLSALNTLLLRYTWAIPSATQSQDNAAVSLYDHSITTAAFASVLFQYHFEKQSLDDLDSINNREEKKFLFVSGDLSGIQRYLFDLKSTKYSSKMLRAKSYELQLLSGYFADKILKESGISEFCKLTDAGGRFLLVLPNTKSVKDNLYKLRIEIEKYFIDEYLGEISFNISKGIAFSQDELKQNNYKEFIRKLNSDVANAKLHKFQSYLLNEPGRNIIENNYNSIDSAKDICEICGKRKSLSVKDGTKICNFCNNQHTLGTMLPKTNYLFFSENKMSNGNYFKISKNSFLQFGKKRESSSQENKTYVVNGYEPGLPSLYAPFYLPVDNNGTPLTFEELAEGSEGNNKLAMYKADVDNLGAIFSTGFGENGSISRFATLSRMLDTFFSGYLHEVIKNNYRDIYTVYSGGDDVCVVGPWNRIMSFASEFNRLFREYTGNNPSITLSAGISLVSSKTPVNIVAEMAEEQLEKSKERKNSDNKLLKNAVTVFNTTVPWNEFSELLIKGEQVSKNIGRKYSKGLVYSVLEYIKRKRNCEEKGSIDPKDLMWKSHLQYSTARNITNTMDREEFVTMIEKDIDGGLPITINYAMYLLRGGENGGTE